MGSLMAGWDSHVSDPKLVKYKRNKSLTKEEIESFWKSKKKNEEEHLRDISLLSPRTQIIALEEAADQLDMENQANNLQKIKRKNGWWMSSNSAFLNEPPVIALEDSAHKYASQFHVADTAGSTVPHGPAGISA